MTRGSFGMSRRRIHWMSQSESRHNCIQSRLPAKTAGQKGTTPLLQQRGIKKVLDFAQLPFLLNGHEPPSCLLHSCSRISLGKKVAFLSFKSLPFKIISNIYMLFFTLQSTLVYSFPFKPPCKMGTIMGTVNCIYLQSRILKSIEFKNLFAHGLSQKAEKAGLTCGCPEPHFFLWNSSPRAVKPEEFKHQWSE